MNPAEAAVLLGIAASYDNRKPDETAAQAWALALEDLTFADCRDAVVAHYRVSPEWLMPSQVRTSVRKVRDKRIADHEHELTPPPDAREGAALHAWLADARRRLGDGEPVAAINPPELDLKPRNLGDLRELVRTPERPADDTASTTTTEGESK